MTNPEMQAGDCSNQGLQVQKDRVEERRADTRLAAAVDVSNQVRVKGKSASRSFELLQKAWMNFLQS